MASRRVQGPRPVLAHGPLASAALSTTTVHAWAVATQPCDSNARASRRRGLRAAMGMNRCLYIFIAIFTFPEMGCRNAFWILRNTGREKSAGILHARRLCSISQG